MSPTQIISWHPDAVLIDRTGTRITAQVVAQIDAEFGDCNPQQPLTALPAFINGIEKGLTPFMGQLNHKRPIFRGDFLTETGGSTGHPKVILRSSESWMLSFSHMTTTYNIGSTAHVAALGHLNHSLALYAALEALHSGATFHALAGLTYTEYSRALAARKITHLYATPSQIRLFKTPVKNLKYIFVGGGALTSDDQIQSAIIFPNAQIMQFYGAAETSFITLSDQQTPEGSVGKPFANVKIAIHASGSTLCPTGVIGEVWVKTPLAYKGYFSDHARLPVNGKGYMNVGELGCLDADNNLFLKGRADRAVTIADQTVYLDDVEAVLTSHPQIKNAAAFTLPDKLRGSKLLAMITATEDHIDLPQIISQIPKSLRPKQIETIQDWPLLPSGKTDYIALKSYLEGHDT
jgi:long-chain acyl-CoA synthetase